MEKEIIINEQKFLVLKEENNALDVEAIALKLTDYFDPFDCVVGDWAYGKLRLKGFNYKENKNYKAINDASSVDEYIKNYCAYGCPYFILKRVK